MSSFPPKALPEALRVVHASRRGVWARGRPASWDAVGAGANRLWPRPTDGPKASTVQKGAVPCGSGDGPVDGPRRPRRRPRSGRMRPSTAPRWPREGRMRLRDWPNEVVCGPSTVRLLDGPARSLHGRSKSGPRRYAGPKPSPEGALGGSLRPFDGPADGPATVRGGPWTAPRRPRDGPMRPLDGP
ncbi:hypothetical protein M885DRAFT_516042 [Pelagophyceae sp. CCMP2097]|nr:hypothetical protein M885DRAFT_516042 [Pelagophyceae sp. CCMP2097]